MKKLIPALLVLLAMTVRTAQAHEGHDHDGPTTLQAPKGGVIKALEETRVEVTSKGKQLKIYLYDKNLKPQPISGFKVTAQAQLPRSKKVEDLRLLPKENHFEAEYDAKGLHRYTLLLSVDDPKTGHKDQLSFTIEPRK